MRIKASSKEKRKIINLRYDHVSKLRIFSFISFEIYTKSEEVAIETERTKRFVVAIIASLIFGLVSLLAHHLYSFKIKDAVEVKPSLDKELQKLVEKYSKGDEQ